MNLQARPKKKVDWRQWSEAQLDLPPREIAIPYPPASKRTQVVPLPEMPPQLSEEPQPADQLGEPDQQPDMTQQPKAAEQLT